MASAREAAITALVTALAATDAEILRDTDVPEAIKPEGVIVVAEGDAQTETVLSPLSYFTDQGVVLDIHVVGADEFDRDAKMDTLLLGVSSAITADRTLGGAVEFADIGAPDFEAYEADGPAKAARVVVTLSFTTVGTPLN